MKKHLIAAAVAGALAVPAMAQVTVSGVIDLGYSSVQQAGTGAAAGTKVRTSTVSDNMVATPTLTIGGSEDLGGGLKASFSIAQEFDAATGTHTDGTAGSYTYSTLSLSGGFGGIAFGRMNHASRDIGGVYRFFGDIGRLPANLNSASRRTNTLQYQTPSIAGFGLSIGYSDAGKDTTNSATEKLTSFGLRGDLAGVKLGASLETTKAAGAAGAKTKLTTVGGSYDFKVAKIGLVYVNLDPDGANNERSGYSVNFAVPLGGAFTVGGSYANYENDATRGEADVMTLALQYALSKRTSVYGSYQSVDSTGAGSGITATRGMGVPEIAGQKSNGYGVSIVHSF